MIEAIILGWVIGGLFVGLAAGVHQEREHARFEAENGYRSKHMSLPITVSLWSWLGAPFVIAFYVLATVSVMYDALIVKLARTHTIPEVSEKRSREADRVLDSDS